MGTKLVNLLEFHQMGVGAKLHQPSIDSMYITRQFLR